MVSNTCLICVVVSGKVSDGAGRTCRYFSSKLCFGYIIDSVGKVQFQHELCLMFCSQNFKWTRSVHGSKNELVHSCSFFFFQNVVASYCISKSLHLFSAVLALKLKFPSSYPILILINWPWLLGFILALRQQPSEYCPFPQCEFELCDCPFSPG